MVKSDLYSILVFYALNSTIIGSYCSQLKLKTSLKVHVTGKLKVQGQSPE